MSVTVGAFVWPVADVPCADVDAATDAQRAAARDRAVARLWALSGRQLGTRLAIWRPEPARAGCTSRGLWIDNAAGGVIGWPLGSGAWETPASQYAVRLPETSTGVLAVVVGGVTLDPHQYRLDDGRWLARVDGLPWPTGQDPWRPDGAGGWAVYYRAGAPVDVEGQHAAGVLACEYLKQQLGVKGCRLTDRATSVTRGGVSVQRDTSRTGVSEVDGWLAAVNPQQVQAPPRVWSPDMPGQNRGDRYLPAGEAPPMAVIGASPVFVLGADEARPAGLPDNAAIIRLPAGEAIPGRDPAVPVPVFELGPTEPRPAGVSDGTVLVRRDN